MNCETCKYCTELGRNAAGDAVMRRCIRKKGLNYEDRVTDNCPEYEYTADPYATRSAKCVSCRFCTAIENNDADCPVKRKCNVTGTETEDFVVFDCPGYQADGKKLIDAPSDNVSFGAKTVEKAEPEKAKKPKVQEDDNKSTIKTILIISAVFLAVIILIKVIGSSGLFGKKEKPDLEIPTAGGIVDYTTDPAFTLPELTTEEPSYVTATMNEAAFITSDVGLKLRSSGSTDGDELAIMPYMAAVTILSSEDGWAYVDYNGMKGWCSEDYLEKGTVTTYTADEVNAALSTANNTIASYFNRPLTGGKASLETAYVITYFQEAENIYKQFVTSPGSLFDETHEDLKCTSTTLTGRYFRVTDDKFTTVEALCEYFFSYFSDDVAKRLLNNKVFCINGNLYVYYGVPQEKHAKVITEPSVRNELNTYTVDLTVKEYDDPLDVNMMTKQYVISLPCSLMNGRWVFTHMEVIPE